MKEREIDSFGNGLHQTGSSNKPVVENGNDNTGEKAAGSEGLSDTIKNAHAAGVGALEKGDEQIGVEKSPADKPSLEGSDQY